MHRYFFKNAQSDIFMVTHLSTSTSKIDGLKHYTIYVGALEKLNFKLTISVSIYSTSSFLKGLIVVLTDELTRYFEHISL